MDNPKQLLNRIKNIFCRGIFKTVDDSGGVQLIQTTLLAGEVRSDIEHPVEYGFTSTAIDGAQTINVFYGGNRDNGSVLTVYDERFRIKDLAAGEVCLYNHEGTKILLKNGSEIEITSGLKVIITSPNTIINGNLTVNGSINGVAGGGGSGMSIQGNISATGLVSDSVRSMQGDRILYNTHTHGATPPPLPQQ